MVAGVDHRHAVLADDGERVAAHDRVAEVLDEGVDAVGDLDGGITEGFGGCRGGGEGEGEEERGEGAHARQSRRAPRRRQ